MKRYFYTDPLAAAWMVRYHALKIHGPVLKAPGERAISTRPMPVWVLARAIETAEKGFGPEDAKYYIGADCVHLLEPKVNDYVEYYNCFLGTVWKSHNGLFLIQETGLNNPPEEEGHFAPMEAVEPENIDRVIQRNGVAFMWPESEDA